MRVRSNFWVLGYLSNWWAAHPAQVEAFMSPNDAAACRFSPGAGHAPTALVEVVD